MATAYVKLESGLLVGWELGVGHSVGELVGCVIIAIPAELIYADVFSHTGPSAPRRVPKALVPCDK